MRWLPACFLAALACGPELHLNPNRGPASGELVVSATDSRLGSFEDPVTVKVGDSLAYDVVRDAPHTIHFTVQSGPGGPAAVVITDRHGLTAQGTFTFFAPKDARFARVVAMGASLTMGVQTSSITVHSQTHGPAAQLAQALGASFGLPLVKDGSLPTITAADFDKTTCRLVGGSINSLLQARAPATMAALTDSKGIIHLDWLRLDAHTESSNVAIGGFRISQDISGGGGLFPVVFQHMIWDPFATQAELFSDPKEKMVDVAVGLNPTLVVSTDLFINDLDNVDLSVSGIPDDSALTPMASFQASLDTVLNRLDATGADLFFADAPDVTLLKSYNDKVQSLLAAGYTQAQATGWLAAIQQRVKDMNAALAAEVAQHPRLHIVPMNAKVADVFANGADVGAVHLTPKPFGGLLSLDNLHFSDTGYALVAQLFLDSINQTYGTQIPAIDTAAVLSQDPFSVANLQAAGFSCAGY